MNRRRFLATSTAVGIAGTTLTACGKSPAIESKMSFEDRQKWLSSFSCNIEMWFKDLDFLDRISAAKAVGFNAIEMWNPRKKKISPDAIADRARNEGMRVTSISPGAPSLANVNNLDDFIEWLEIAVELANMFNVPNFNVTGHKTVDGLSDQEMIEVYIEAMKVAAPILEAGQKTATIEPYNPFDHQGHFIYGVEPALSICKAVKSPSIKMNWDFFHMQRTNGNLITHLENGIDEVGYMQLADSPSRLQPGTEEIAFGPILTRTRELGYKGFIGAECYPKDQDSETAAIAFANLAKSINLEPPSIA